MDDKFSVGLKEVKNYLRLEEDFTEDDTFLQLALTSAKSFVLNYLGNIEKIPEEASIATLVLVSHWYFNRSIVTDRDTLAKELPFVFNGLLAQSRNWKVGNA